MKKRENNNVDTSDERGSPHNFFKKEGGRGLC